jgi:hypothetical protein
MKELAQFIFVSTDSCEVPEIPRQRPRSSAPTSRNIIRSQNTECHAERPRWLAGEDPNRVIPETSRRHGRFQPPILKNAKMIVRGANEPQDCSLSARLRGQNERVSCHGKKRCAREILFSRIQIPFPPAPRRLRGVSVVTA